MSDYAPLCMTFVASTTCVGSCGRLVSAVDIYVIVYCALCLEKHLCRWIGAFGWPTELTRHVDVTAVLERNRSRMEDVERILNVVIVRSQGGSEINVGG